MQKEGGKGNIQNSFCVGDSESIRHENIWHEFPEIGKLNFKCFINSSFEHLF